MTAAVLEEEPEAGISAIDSIMGVMRKVDLIRKDGENTNQHYNFRGIDAVMNAVGPALREVGGFVLPVRTKRMIEHGTTNAGKGQLEVHLQVTFRWYGEDGSFIEGMAEGEANDTADKATSKAHSVALRTFLLQTLMLPTDEPDPDQFTEERSAKPATKKAPPPPRFYPATEEQIKQAVSQAHGAMDFEEATVHHRRLNAMVAPQAIIDALNVDVFAQLPKTGREVKNGDLPPITVDGGWPPPDPEAMKK